MKKGAADTLDRRQDNPTTCDHLLRTQVSVHNQSTLKPTMGATRATILNAVCCILYCIVGHSSPGGNLSDEEQCVVDLAANHHHHGRRICSTHEFESICLSSSSNPPTTATRPRSGSCASRRSQFR